MGENIAKGWKKFWCGFWKPVIMRINHVRPLNWFLGWMVEKFQVQLGQSTSSKKGTGEEYHWMDRMSDAYA